MNTLGRGIAQTLGLFAGRIGGRRPRSRFKSPRARARAAGSATSFMSPKQAKAFKRSRQINPISSARSRSTKSPRGRARASRNYATRARAFMSPKQARAYTRSRSRKFPIRRGTR